MHIKMVFLFVILLVISPIVAQDALLDDLLVDYVANDDPSVVIYVRIGDEEAVAVRGLADLDNEISATTDDLYRIGSITKPFVATIIMQLVEDDMLSLDDPIANYLPEDIVSRVENADAATVRQMLQMTSGIFSYTDSDAFDDATVDDPSYAWTAAETITFAYDEPAYFAPGEDYYYSNTNFNLAQLIIESLTESTLADELQTRIFEPLEMDSCYLETPDVFAQNIVRGYSDYDGVMEDMTEYNDGVGLGDGGIVCTAADLAKFLPGLVNQLLTEDLLAAMLATVDDGDGGQYGLGIGADETEIGLIIGHDGATSGFQSTMSYVIEEDLVVVVLTNNFDSEIVGDLAFEVIEMAGE